MNALRTWRLLGAVGMGLGALSLVVTTVIQWMLQPADPRATIVDAIGQHPTAWLTASIVAVLGPLVWVGGIVSVTMLVRFRGWVLTTAGGYITGIGLIAGVGHLALYFGLYGDLAFSGLGGVALRSLAGADDRNPLSGLLLVIFLVAFSLGPILLTVGLRRARLVAVWVPVAAIVMTVANFVGGIAAGGVQLAAMLLTFVPMIVVLLRVGRPAPVGLQDEKFAADSDRRSDRTAARRLLHDS